MQRITELTGRRLSDPAESAELVIAFRALRLQGEAAIVGPEVIGGM